MKQYITTSDLDAAFLVEDTPTNAVKLAEKELKPFNFHVFSEYGFKEINKKYNLKIIDMKDYLKFCEKYGYKPQCAKSVRIYLNYIKDNEYYEEINN